MSARPEFTPRIHRLPPLLADQIAAGEVVERPASVVKELLENSLDSGARRVEVTVERGGLRRIHVWDDGCGIHPEDLELALSRHATSKVSELNELLALRSFGFRGEALPSIASVSRISVTSRASGAHSGCALRREADTGAARPEPAAHPVGTTVEVRDLFFNTPARRKFLRTERTEFAHIQKVFQRAALSCYPVALTLRHNEKVIQRLTAAAQLEDMERRVASICGREFLSHAVRLEFEASALRLWGWIARPPYSRSQTGAQYFAVNGRVVSDPVVRHAVRQAYHGALYPDRHPAYVLCLELDPHAVDVNVHPTKHEVRFRDSRMVHDFVFSCAQRALSGAPAEHQPRSDTPDPVLEPAAGQPDTRAHGWSGPYAVAESPASAPARQRPVVEQEGPYGAQPKVGPLGRALALLGKDYILAEADAGLVVVHRRRAIAHVTGERLREAWEQGPLRVRPLLLPIARTMPRSQADAVDAHEDLLRSLGFELGRAGPDRVLLRQVPEALEQCDLGGVLHALLAALGREETRDPAFRPRLAVQLAQAGRRDAGTIPSLDEMDALLRAVEKTGMDAAARGLWRLVPLGELGPDGAPPGEGA